jgi:hypothetical protein
VSLLQVAAAAAAAAGAKVRVAVLGASGYTGEEVVRLLALHPTFKITTLTGDRQAGKVGSRWMHLPAGARSGQRGGGTLAQPAIGAVPRSCCKLAAAVACHAPVWFS